MSTYRIYLVLGAITASAWIASFFVFDLYIDKVCNEIVNSTLAAEAASIQQGNLLASLTKLQSAIVASESLKGIAAYNVDKPDQPLILLGQMPRYESKAVDTSIRMGFFDRVYVRMVSKQMQIAYYFNPRFVFWTFLAYSFALIIFAVLVAQFSRRLEGVRFGERANAMNLVSKQVSHDIQSPLSAANVFATALARKGTDVQLLTAAIKRISEIVEDLKFRADTECQLLGEEIEFKFEEIVRIAVDEKQAVYPNQPIILSGHCDRLVLGVEGHFKRMLSNLLNNAIEANPSRSPIEVAFGNRNNECFLSIKDYGVGMTSDQKKRIFERGYTMGKLGGSGLGLYHARIVMQKMQGSIDVSSEPDCGTLVELSFPSKMPRPW